MMYLPDVSKIKFYAYILFTLVRFVLGCDRMLCSFKLAFNMLLHKTRQETHSAQFLCYMKGY